MKILINNTEAGVYIEDIGKELLPSEVKPLDAQWYALFAGSAHVASFIDDGTLSVSDGTNILSKEEAKAYLKLSENALGIRFATTTNLVSKNTRDAIEEVKSSSEKPHFSIQVVKQDTTLLIPENEQMTIHGVFYLEGEVDIEGQLVLED